MIRQILIIFLLFPFVPCQAEAAPKKVKASKTSSAEIVRGSLVLHLSPTDNYTFLEVRATGLLTARWHFPWPKKHKEMIDWSVLDRLLAVLGERSRIRVVADPADISRHTLSSLLRYLRKAKFHAHRWQPPKPPRNWRSWLSIGPALLVDFQGSLGDQLRAGGYEVPVMGFRASLALERWVLPWLLVGGDGAFVMHNLERDTFYLDQVSKGDLGLTGSHGFYQLGFLPYVQPTVSFRDKGVHFEFGAQLGIGGGMRLWAIDGDIETSAFFSLSPALVWSFRAKRFMFSFCLGAAYLVHGNIGPIALKTHNQWLLNPRMRFGWQW